MRKLTLISSLLLLLSTFFLAFNINAKTKKSFEIERPFIRKASAGANTAIYFSIKNLTAENYQIVGAKFSGGKATELHTVRNRNGVMRMRKVDSFSLPANSQFQFVPKGNHIMVIGLKEKIEEEKKYQLELELKKEEGEVIESVKIEQIAVK